MRSKLRLSNKKYREADVQSGIKEAVQTDEKKFANSGEDITAVDHKDIYCRIKSQGKWVQVKPEETGMKPGSAFFEDPEIKSLDTFFLTGFNS